MKYLNFNSKLTGLLFIQSPPGKGKYFQTSVFKLKGIGLDITVWLSGDWLELWIQFRIRFSLSLEDPWDVWTALAPAAVMDGLERRSSPLSFIWQRFHFIVRLWERRSSFWIFIREQNVFIFHLIDWSQAGVIALWSSWQGPRQVRQWLCWQNLPLVPLCVYLQPIKH